MIVTIAGVVYDIEPTDDQLGQVSIGLAAFDGEVGNGTFPVGVTDISESTGRQFKVAEGSTVLSDGFDLDQDRTRETEPQANVTQFGLMDANALLDGFRIARSRPSETDVARVLAFAALDGPSWDTTWVLVSETVTMPAKKYYSDGGWTSELIPDVVAFTGKTLFLHDKAAGGRCLHYHNLVSGHGCGLSISDVPADVDHVTVWEPWSPVRNRTSVDLRNSVKGVDQSGRTSIQSDATSIAAHDADGLYHEAQPSFEAVSQGDLNVQTAAFLASQKNDLDTWTCQIGPLDEDALALIRVGDIITVTSAVMGLSADDQRISHMTLTPAIGEAGTAVPDVWMADLEMGAPIRRRRRKAAKATVDRVEHTPVQDDLTGIVAGCFGVGSFGTWESVGSATPPDITLDSGAVGNTILWNPTAGTLPSAPDAFRGGRRNVFAADLDASEITITFDINVGAIDPSAAICQLFLSAGIYLGAAGTVEYDFIGTGGFTAAVTAWDAGTTYIIGDHVWRAGQVYIATAGGINHQPPNGSFWALAAYNLSANHLWKGKLKVNASQRGASIWSATESEPTFPNYQPMTTPGGTFAPFSVFTGGIIAAKGLGGGTFPGTVSVSNIVICYDGTGVPAYHWTVYGPIAPQETPDGATATFTIPTYPGGGYVPGTLVIAVDGIDQTTAQTDPDAGTGTISWEPTADDAVTVRWLVP